MAVLRDCVLSGIPLPRAHAIEARFPSSHSAVRRGAGRRPAQRLRCRLYDVLSPPPVPGTKYGAVAGVIVTVLALFVFASGARRYLLYIIGVPLALMVVYLTLGGVLAPHEWIHVTNPVVAGIAVVAMSLIQEPIFYNEFKMRQMALESNAKLKQAQEMLKQAHDEQLQRHRTELAHVARLSMMGEMAASLAHELNQPLHAVNNYASGSLMRLLKTPQRDEELVAALKQIGEEANRAAEIVRRVRRSSRNANLNSPKCS